MKHETLAKAKRIQHRIDYTTEIKIYAEGMLKLITSEGSSLDFGMDKAVSEFIKTFKGCSTNTKKKIHRLILDDITDTLEALNTQFNDL